jgi:hypothetical protein
MKLRTFLNVKSVFAQWATFNMTSEVQKLFFLINQTNRRGLLFWFLGLTPPPPRVLNNAGFKAS